MIWALAAFKVELPCRPSSCRTRSKPESPPDRLTPDRGGQHGVQYAPYKIAALREAHLMVRPTLIASPSICKGSGPAVTCGVAFSISRFNCNSSAGGSKSV